MIYQEESYFDVKDDIKPLLEKHWDKAALYKDKIKIDPDWNAYKIAYTHGILKIYTARKDGDLVGYIIVSVVPNMHSKSHIMASCDLIFVIPEARKGMTGYKLIKYAEIKLKELGVSVFNINTKVDAPFDSLMERMSYNLEERAYSKYIG